MLSLRFSSTSSPMMSAGQIKSWEAEEKDESLLVDILDTTTEEIRRKMTANEVWQMIRNLKVKVELNSNGHGNDNGSNLLVRFLGKLARTSTLCPIHIENWDFMPKDKRAQQWKLIEDHFLFDYAAGCKWVMSTLGDRLKSYKYQLRCKYFYLYNTKEKLLANRPPNVDSGDWSAFVRHYHDDKMKEKIVEIELPGISSHFVGPQDSFAQVMGPKHFGRVLWLSTCPHFFWCIWVIHLEAQLKLKIQKKDVRD